MSEGFEGNFPADNAWSVGDANATNGLAYWDDVHTSFGTVPARTGFWKGYCAGVGYVGPSTSPLYTNNMQAFASKTLNLAGYSGANLSFWYNIPSIETNFDFLRVFMDATPLFSTTVATPGWTFVSLPLNAYLGGSHTLSFEFDADVTVVYEGAYLDDIVVDAANQPILSSLQSLQNANYSGYVLDSDSILGRSNIQAQAVFNVENFTGVNTSYTNVLSFRLINAGSGAPHPIYNAGNVTTNAGYTYDITNVLSLAAGTNVTVTDVAYLRPAAWMSQFTNFYIECRMLTNGVLAQTLATAPANYYHFTNRVAGDAAFNVLLNLTNSGWSRTHAVQTISGQDSFQVNAGYEIRRWDDVGLGIATTNIPVVFNYVLRDGVGNVVPLVRNSQTFFNTVSNYQVVFIFPVPTFTAVSRTLDIQPSVQLDSVNKTYFLTVTIAHTNNPVTGQVLTANARQTSTNELLHFNGNLYFASVGTTLSSLGLAPTVNPPSGGVIPTTLNSVGGYVTGKSDHTYSGGGPLNVSLYPNGDAIVTAGSVVLSGPVPDDDSIARVRYRRGTVVLSPTGASAAVKVTLPTGLGYRFDMNSMVLLPSFVVTGVPLDSTLAPATDQTYSPGGTLFVVEESKPVWMPTDKIIWHVGAGKFDLPPLAVTPSYVRGAAYAYLLSVSNSLVDPPNMADKRSNDKYWIALNGTTSLPTVAPDTGSNALLTVNFSFGAGGFETHFPYGTGIRWTGAGAMQVSDDLVTPGAGSALNATANVAVGYTRDCPDCGGAGAGNTHVNLIPSGGLLNFTRDGGLVASGATTTTVNLQWGYIGSPTLDFAQQAFQFNTAGFHMPGMFLRGDQNSLPAVQRPTTILYSGVMATNPVVIERPLTAGYSQGLADYAGMNFRCVSDGLHGARSTIAGQKNINWLLDFRSKYYIRPAGVTGIHEAVPGSFPSSLTLWGYQFTFTSYALSYLDSQNKDSVTDGAVDLPAPSDFIQGFNNMRFSCLGAPQGGDVPQGDGYKVMSYWVADFKTLSIQFKTPASCTVTTGYLALGIEGHASHVDKPLFGVVGFFNNGDLIPPSFGLDGVTSRLKLPNVINIDGPNKSTYVFTPVQDAYYNTFNNSPSAPVAGWMNIFGKLDLPFFEDLQLHLQTSCHTNGVAASNAPIYLSGGWPRAGTSNPNYGWLDSLSRTPFETNLFDANNLGWPGNGTIDIVNYRDNSGDQKYHPRAQRLWLGVIDFDYPLSWNITLRSFKSWEQVEDDLLILNVQHEIKYMDGKRAELDFGAQYDGLPQISIANLAFNAIDEATGIGDAIVKAAAQPVEDILSSGLDEMDKLLDAQMKGLMDGVFDKTVDPIIDKFYAQLLNEWNGLSLAERLQFVQNVQTNSLNFFVGTGPLSSTLTPLTTALKDLGNGVSQASNLVGQVRGFLRDATNGINAVVGTINMTTNGQSLGSNVVGLITKQGGSRPVVPKLLNSLVGEIAPQFVDAVIGPAVSNLLSEIEGPLEQITGTLTQTRGAIMEVDKQLGVAGDFTTEIGDKLNQFRSQLTNVSLQVSLSVTQYFAGFDYHIDDPFQHVSAADIKKFIRQKIEDQFFATDAAAAIQTAIRQRVYDLDAAMKNQIDSVFQQLNDVLRDLISQSLAEVDNSINKCLGDVSDVMGAGKINGHALIVGDSLKELRIDGHFQWKVPDNFELNAFLLIKELDSDGSPGCSSPAGPFTEVTIGATDVPIGWISSDMKANVEAKFTFDGTVPFPVNLAGQLELIGDLKFEAFTLHDLAVALAFGKYENYLALKGGVRFDGYDFSGAIFFGRTCTLDPLKLIDPQVASVLGDPPFTGAYCYAQGWLPISELVLGIPASCLFDISAGVGAGAFYFAEGPTYGGKMFLGVSGELLCIVSIEGDITMIGVKHGDDLSFNGHGHFEADIGPCPFCISVSKSVNVSYVHKSWHIE